jgi:hypothetical protein
VSGPNEGEGQAPAREGPGSGERPGREAARAEVAEPRGRPRQARRHRFSWRAPVAALLIILGCIPAPLSVLGVWTANQLSDTGRYVANVTPLIKDPAIQNALTSKLTSEIVTKIDVKGLTDQAAADLSQKGFTAEQEEQTMPGIVVGVDGSLNSERALDWAMKAAATQHAPLTAVLAVHEVMKSYWTGKPVHDQHLGLTTSGRRS